jgi:DNA invertase Pin-like site-specific DNA recombinase
VALYARVSTSHNGQNPEVQLRELRAYCLRRGLSEITEYVDHGVSGAKEKRPALGRLLTDAHRAKFDAVLVWKLDRLARSLRHLVSLLDEFSALGVELVSLTEAIDTTTPAGRALFGMVGIFAEFERDLVRERVKAGIEAARAKGKKLGRPRFDVDVAEVWRLRAQGLSAREIADKVQCVDGKGRRVKPSRAFIQRLLQNPGGNGSSSERAEAPSAG